MCVSSLRQPSVAGVPGHSIFWKTDSSSGCSLQPADVACERGCVAGLAGYGSVKLWEEPDCLHVPTWPDLPAWLDLLTSLHLPTWPDLPARLGLTR